MEFSSLAILFDLMTAPSILPKPGWAIAHPAHPPYSGIELRPYHISIFVRTTVEMKKTSYAESVHQKCGTLKVKD